MWRYPPTPALPLLQHHGPHPAGGGHMSGGRGGEPPHQQAFLFETTRLCRLRLNAYLAQHLESLQGGKIALCPIPLEVERETGVTEDDMEDVSNFARNLEGGEPGGDFPHGGRRRNQALGPIRPWL